jgi:hypothetical protein
MVEGRIQRAHKITTLPNKSEIAVREVRFLTLDRVLMPSGQPEPDYM